MRGVFALAMLAGCGRVDFAAHALDAAADADINALPWSTAQPITILDSGGQDADPTLTADELEMYFSSDRPGVGATDIYRTVRGSTADAWGVPALVMELSSASNDDSPEVSADGLTLWQASNRGGNYRIYVSTRATRGDAWSAPAIVTELGAGAQNLAVTPNGLITVVEISTGGNGDLYEARRISPHDTWGTPVLIAELSTADNESSPTLDAEGLTIYFTSNRPGTQGTYDIWMATRSSLATPFGAATRVDALDTAGDDGNPFLTIDGHTMYWGSDRPPTQGARDIWFATR
ncbi:MAG: hypothetical protein QM831_05670 [Kofleriaceae bacterium]